jgi:hypothetical protein
VGLGRRAGGTKTKLVSNTSYTPPQGLGIHLVRYEFRLEAYLELQPVGWPG